jgi:hypothetical protein
LSGLGESEIVLQKDVAAALGVSQPTISGLVKIRLKFMLLFTCDTGTTKADQWSLAMSASKTSTTIFVRDIGQNQSRDPRLPFFDGSV